MVGVTVALTVAGAVLVGGAVVVVVVGVLLVVVEVTVLVVVFVVMVVGLVFVVMVLGAVLVTVVDELGFTIVVGPRFCFAFDEPPKKVVGWPLPVIERPARRSGTV